jgi:hypothetical protein
MRHLKEDNQIGRLYQFLRDNPGWHDGGEIVRKCGGYNPATTASNLRLMLADITKNWRPGLGYMVPPAHRVPRKRKDGSIRIVYQYRMVRRP